MAVGFTLLRACEDAAIRVGRPSLQRVGLPEMELTNNVQVVLHQSHVLDELGQKLDQGVDLEANSPALLPYHFVEDISSVIERKELVRKVRQTEDLGIDKWILCRQKNLKFELLERLRDQVGLNFHGSSCHPDQYMEAQLGLSRRDGVHVAIKFAYQCHFLINPFYPNIVR